MKIEFKLYASLACHMPEKADGNPNVMEVTEGMTIGEVLEQLKVPIDVVRVIFLNGIHAKGDEVLKEGDRVGVFPPVGGG